MQGCEKLSTYGKLCSSCWILWGVTWDTVPGIFYRAISLPDMMKTIFISFPLILAIWVANTENYFILFGINCMKMFRACGKWELHLSACERTYLLFGLKTLPGFSLLVDFQFLDAIHFHTFLLTVNSEFIYPVKYITISSYRSVCSSNLLLHAYSFVCVQKYEANAKQNGVERTA